MELRAIYEYCTELKPFIKFNAELNNGEVISCIGHEWHCYDPKCNCYLTNIMVHEASSGDKLTQIIYGWRNYEYYRKERFFKEDIKEFIKGDLSFMVPRNEQNIAILTSFKSWLSSNHVQKVRLFTERYKQFKIAIKNNYFNEKAELEMFLDLMNEVAMVGRLEEFIFRLKK